MTAVGRIVKSADFERVLAMPPRARSEHFAMHHLPGEPARPAKPTGRRSDVELSTSVPPARDRIVDDSVLSSRKTLANAARLWLGMVVPKRHARRAVSRNLMKRQMRAAVQRHAADLEAGLWVMRLRAPFDKARFVSAASAALKQAACAELEGLLASAAQPRRAR